MVAAGNTGSPYGNLDLLTKQDRSKATPKKDPVTEYIQNGLNKLGASPTLKIDGSFGTKTETGVKSFQEACKLKVTGVADQDFYEQLDWRLFDYAWKPCSKTTNRDSCAIKNGCNTYTGHPVDANGMQREGLRLMLATDAFMGLQIGWRGAVNRPPRGGSPNDVSWHGTGLANDDRNDIDQDRIFEDWEKIKLNSLKSFLYLSAVSRPLHYQTITLSIKGKSTTKDRSWRGPYRLCTIVIGNYKLPDGTYVNPSATKLRDTSWSAARNSFKSLSGTVHMNPIHLHDDCAPGAPVGRP